jgi:hypothetical protein
VITVLFGSPGVLAYLIARDLRRGREASSARADRGS